MDITRIRRAIDEGSPSPVPPGWWRRAATVEDLDPDAVLAALDVSVDEAMALFPPP